MQCMNCAMQVSWFIVLSSEFNRVESFFGTKSRFFFRIDVWRAVRRSVLIGRINSFKLSFVVRARCGCNWFRFLCICLSILNVTGPIPVFIFIGSNLFFKRFHEFFIIKLFRQQFNSSKTTYWLHIKFIIYL